MYVALSEKGRRKARSAFKDNKDTLEKFNYLCKEDHGIKKFNCDPGRVPYTSQSFPNVNHSYGKTLKDHSVERVKQLCQYILNDRARKRSVKTCV